MGDDVVEEVQEEVVEETPEEIGIGDEPSDEEVLDEIFEDVDAEDGIEDEDLEDEPLADEPIEGDDAFEEEEEDRAPILELGELVAAEGEEEEEEQEVFADDVTDETIANQMWMVDTYADWLKLGKEQENEVSDRFAAMVARNEVNPEYLAERNIFSMSDLMAYTEGIEEKTSPDAVLYPMDDDEEGILNFDAEYRDIPKTPDEYDERVFQNSLIEDDKEAQNEMRLRGTEARLSNAQMAMVLDWFGEEKEIADQKHDADLKDHIKEQEKKMVSLYGTDLREVIKNVNKLLFAHGKEFAAAHGESKAVKSVEFLNLMTSLLESGDVDNKIKFDDVKLRLQTISETKLLAMKEQVNKDPRFNDAKKTGTKAERRAYRVISKRWSAILDEMTRRDMEI